MADQDAKGEAFDIDLDSASLETKRAVAALTRARREERAALAAARAEAEELRKTAEGEHRRVAKHEADSMDWVHDEKLRAKIAAIKPKPGEPQPDPSSPEGITYLVRQEAARLIEEELFGGMVELQERKAREALEAENKAHVERRKKEIYAYVEQTPELASQTGPIYERTIELMKRFGTDPKHPSLFKMDVKEAHEIVLLQMAKEQRAEEKVDLLEEARAKIVQGGGHGRRLPERPKEATGDELLSFYSANPEVLKQEMEKAREKGLLAR